MKESTIKRNIVKWLRCLRSSQWEVTPPGSRPGKPDITGCWQGHYVAIEVKTETGKLTKLQDYELKQLNKVGATAFVARSVEDVKKVLL